MKKSGFMLFELLVVLALITLMAGISVPLVWVLDDLKIQHECNTLTMTMLALQQKAYSQQKTLVLELHPETQSYSCPGREPYTLDQSVYFGVLPDSEGPPGAGQPVTPSTVLRKGVSFKQAKITFYPSGTVKAGSVYLKDTHNRHAYALTIAPGTSSYIRRYHATHEQDVWELC